MLHRKIYPQKQLGKLDKKGRGCYIRFCNYDEKIIANSFNPFLNGLAAKESVPEENIPSRLRGIQAGKHGLGFINF